MIEWIVKRKKKKAAVYCEPRKDSQCESEPGLELNAMWLRTAFCPFVSSNRLAFFAFSFFFLN